MLQIDICFMNYFDLIEFCLFYVPECHRHYLYSYFFFYKFPKSRGLIFCNILLIIVVKIIKIIILQNNITKLSVIHSFDEQHCVKMLTIGIPNKPNSSMPVMDHSICSHEAVLSPNQCAAWTPVPAKVDRVRIKLLLLGKTFCTALQIKSNY